VLGASLRSCAGLAAALVVLAPAIAHAGTGFVMRQDALASTGGVSITGPHVLGMTLGQTFTGTSSGDPHIEHAGFWRPGYGSLVGVEPSPAGAVPASFALGAAAPNPSRGQVSFRLGLPDAVSSASVRLRVFDVSGRLVTELPVRDRGPGWHDVHWNGHDAADGPVGLGIYFLRMDAGTLSATRRFVVFR